MNTMEFNDTEKDETKTLSLLSNERLEDYMALALAAFILIVVLLFY